MEIEHKTTVSPGYRKGEVQENRLGGKQEAEHQSLVLEGKGMSRWRFLGDS